MDFKNKKISIIGLAKSGLSSAKILKDMGAKVFVSEKAINANTEKFANELKQYFIDFELGSHTKSKLVPSDLFIISPGVSLKSEVANLALDNNIPIISEIELGYLISKGSIVAVGGTNGKTTVTTLLGEIFKNSSSIKDKSNVFVCGNIGTPFTDVAPLTNKDSIIVLEVSSFQLDTIDKFKPKVSIILNITQDHLDRYDSMDDYRLSKARTFLNQDKSDFLVLNHDDEPTRSLDSLAKCKVYYFSRFKKVEGAYLVGDSIYTNIGGKEGFFCKTSILKLIGNHNIENCMAAIVSGLVMNIKKEDIIKVLESFTTLKHRIEYVDTINGVKFIDDSKATNVDGVKRAIEAFNEPIILIAGGLDKNSDFTVLRDVVEKRVKKLVLIGSAKEKIRDAFKGLKPVVLADTMEEAVKKAFDGSSKGDVVLLSPLCASFDMFNDYGHRGDVFKESVKKLKKENISI